MKFQCRSFVQWFVKVKVMVSWWKFSFSTLTYNTFLTLWKSSATVMYFHLDNGGLYLLEKPTWWVLIYNEVSLFSFYPKTLLLPLEPIHIHGLRRSLSATEYVFKLVCIYLTSVDLFVLSNAALPEDCAGSCRKT